MSASSTELGLVLNRLDDLSRMLRGVHVSPWLSSAEAANYLRCSISQIEKLTRRGLLPFSRQDSTSPKSPRLYHRRHLDSYLIGGRNPLTQRISPAEKRLVEELL